MRDDYAMTNTPNRDAFNAATTMIDRLTLPCTDCPPIRADHPHDLYARALRDLLIDRNATPTPQPIAALDDAPAYIYDALRALLATIDAYPYSREYLTKLLLDNSLCPLHCIDYAICFDDDDDECLAIRMIHPDHDT